jgi:hypothetical protein
MRSLLALAPSILVLAGCGASNKTASANVSGKVTLNGQPLSGGTLHFHSAGGVYTAPVDAEGNYRAVDLPPGEVTVTVDNEYLNPDKKTEVYKGQSGNAPRAAPKGGGGDLSAKYGKTMSGPGGGTMVAKGPGVKVAPPPEGAQVVKEGTYVAIPAAYKKEATSTLKFSIQPGNNDKDLEMSGK